MHPYTYALASALLWTVATQFFAIAGRKMPVRRVNLIKAVFSLVCFYLASLLSSGFSVEQEAFYWLIASGIIGFALGDMLIFTSFSRMGPARTMMIASFQPAIIAVCSYFLFGRALQEKQILGVSLMIACILVLSLEKKKRSDVKWSTLFIAFVGIFLDALGVVLSKQAFLLDEHLQSFTANFYRIGAALPIIVLINYKKGVWERIIKTPRKAIYQTLLAAFLGTFLALYCYLTAISKADAATVSAVVLCVPLLASAYEHAMERKAPSPAFIVASLIMIYGMTLLL